jgi:integrase
MGKSTDRTSRRRSAGEGSVYQNGDRWRGAVTWTEPDGTQRRRTVSGRTSADARDKLDALRRDLRLGTLAPAGPALTLGDYLTGWVERHRVRPTPTAPRNGLGSTSGGR